MKKVLIIAAVVAAVFAAGNASAACVPSQSFGSFISAGDYMYLNFSQANTPDASTGITGSFYLPGAKASNNSGSYDVSLWLLKYAAYATLDNWYLYGGNGAGGVVGCPSPNMTFELWAQGDNNQRTFLMVNTTRNVGVFDYEMGSAKCGTNFAVAGPAPVYRVTSSSRSGNTVNTSGNIPAPTIVNCDGASNDPTAINVYTQTSATEPSSDVSAGWTLAGSVSGAGGSFSVDADCSDTNADVWVATGIVAGGDPLVLGPATAIECDPNLADPRIRVIDRPGNFDRIRARSR